MRDRDVGRTRALDRPLERARAAVRDRPEFGVLRLQRAAGNRAVAALLQRQGDDEPLTDAQVKKALAFYAAQRARYTPDIIRQIQAKVGVDQTGVADAAFTQAVAVWQRD